MVILWLCHICDALAVHYKQSKSLKSKRESLMSCYIIFAMIVIYIEIILVAKSTSKYLHPS